MTRVTICFALIFQLAQLSTGCIKAPDLVVVDRHTALEDQAAGEYRALERDVRLAGVSPKGEDYTRGQLEQAGVTTANAELDEALRLGSAVQTDSELLDALLRRQCIGEAWDGLLRETAESCTGSIDVAATARAMQRENRNRRQVWAYIREQRPLATDDQVRTTWREIHMREVICGANVQDASGAWGRKPC